MTLFDPNVPRRRWEWFHEPAQRLHVFVFALLALLLGIAGTIGTYTLRGIYFTRTVVVEVAKPAASVTQTPAPAATATSTKSAKVPTIHHHASVDGDTFSDLTWELYGIGYEPAYTEAFKHTDGLTDGYNLSIGQELCFPDSIVVNGRTYYADIHKAERRWKKKHSQAKPAAKQFSKTISAEPVATVATRQIDSAEGSVESPTVTYVADPSVLPVVIPMTTESLMPTLVQSNKTIIGHQILLSSKEAAGIPKKRELQTCIVLERTNQRDCSLTSWATTGKQNGTLLKVSLADMPAEPFSVLVAGVRSPVTIAGDRFMSEAKPFDSQFPHPSRTSKFLWGLEGIGMRGGIATLTAGPIAGVVAGFAPLVARPIIGHFASGAERKARKEYERATIALKDDHTSKKEIR